MLDFQLTRVLYGFYYNAFFHAVTWENNAFNDGNALR